MNEKTPIAVFTYNRPLHLSQLFDSLLQCTRLDECQVYIFCDGEKKTDHVENIRAAREVARSFVSRLKDARLVERAENLGLAHSIVSGVTELCERYGRVIVLEDDLILHPFFLDFMLQSLNRYSDDERVAQVAGFTFPIDASLETDAFFLPLTTSWGWATWQRAWKLFSWDIESALIILDTDSQMRVLFDLDDVYPYSNMLRLAAEGKVDSWAIRWYWNTFLANMLTLYPRQSLVWQNGLDASATHTRTSWENLQFSLLDFLQTRWQKPLTFQEVVQTNNLAFEKLKDFLRQKPPFTISGWIRRILNKYVYP